VRSADWLSKYTDFRKLFLTGDAYLTNDWMNEEHLEIQFNGSYGYTVEFCVIFCALFYHTVSISDYIASNVMMITLSPIDEQGIVKDLERSDCGLSQHFPGGNGKTRKNLSQDTWCSGQDSNPAPSEYRSRLSMLVQPVH
jgi:hypothetical protein